MLYEVITIVEIVHAQETLDLADPRVLVQHDAARFLVDLVVLLLFQKADDRIDPCVLVRRLLGRARDDEGSPGLVDQDRIHFVHDRVVELPLYHILRTKLLV